MAYLAIRSLANSLLDSIRAAAFVGPKARSPAALNASTTPAANATSGPTTVRPMPFCAAKSEMAFILEGKRLSSTTHVPVFVQPQSGTVIRLPALSTI